MPDRGAAPRRRRRSSQHLTQQTDWPSRGYDGLGGPAGLGSLGAHLDQERQQRSGGQHRLGIPRILGRRARWVGARLRREA